MSLFIVRVLKFPLQSSHETWLQATGLEDCQVQSIMVSESGREWHFSGNGSSGTKRGWELHSLP